MTRIVLRLTYLIRKNPEVSLQLFKVSLFFAVILVPVRPASLSIKLLKVIHGVRPVGCNDRSIDPRCF